MFLFDTILAVVILFSFLYSLQSHTAYNVVMALIAIVCGYAVDHYFGLSYSGAVLFTLGTLKLVYVVITRKTQTVTYT